MRRRPRYDRIIVIMALALGLFTLTVDYIRRKITPAPSSQEILDSIIVSEKDDENPEEPETPDDSDDTLFQPSVLTDGNGHMIRYHYDEVKSSDKGKGNLILIDALHQADPSLNTSGTVLISSGKQTQSYKLAYMDITADSSLITSLNQMFDDFYEATSIKDVTVSSGYVSPESQREKYIRPEQKLITSENMFAPGHSEHHTGCAIDLLIVSDSMEISQFEGTGVYSWLVSKCSKYGFIQRYPTGKESITGVSGLPGHFRYVGAPHSMIMAEKSMTLEEYLKVLKDYTYDKEHYCYETSDYEYEIYYVPAKGETTQIPVPYEYQYSVSGNNTDGFIVTMSILKNRNHTLSDQADTDADNEW